MSRASLASEGVRLGSPMASVGLHVARTQAWSSSARGALVQMQAESVSWQTDLGSSDRTHCNCDVVSRGRI